MVCPIISYTYVHLVKRVALGLSIEDGEEMARGLYCIRAHERFTTHLLGSAWLCYYVMLGWFWAPMALEIALEQQPDQVRIADYELALQAGVRALNVWKVCDRNAGIVHAFARRAPLVVDADEDAPRESWTWLAVAVALLLAAILVGPAHHGPVLLATFTPFYIDQQTGASNLNAGSTSANAGGSSASAFNYAGGTFVRATGVFTVAAGANPLTDGVTVGTYASVYTTAGAVAATFVAQITARDATTITVDVTTLKWGVATSVSEAAAATTLKVSGAWASEVVLAATGLGTFTAPTSTKINFTGNLSVAASRVVSMVGAATAPIWISGYTTTPGDLDADTTNALAKPVWTLGATFQLSGTGVNQTISGLSLVGNRSGTILGPASATFVFVRCRSENTSSNAAATALTNNQVGTLSYCWFKCPTTATSAGTVDARASQMNCIGCVADTGGLAGWNIGAVASAFFFCVGLNNVGAGLLASTAALRVVGFTSYGATVDGIKWTGAVATNAATCVVGSLFSGLNGSTATTNGINNALGTNTNTIFRACNDYYNVTNAEVGMGDSPAFFPQTDSNAVATSATDMTPVAGSNARANGFPGIYENETFSAYPNIGAVQHRHAGRVLASPTIAGIFP